jgi:hypothetical protein
MRVRSLFMTLTLTTLGGLGNTMSQEIDSLRAIFANPPREFTSGPLWVWNDMLTEEQIVSTLEDLASQNVRQPFIHPRPGLMTPYLSEDWFRLWKKALETAERLDMNIWIYDENSYPSGFAGGYVPEAMPESRGLGLTFEEVAAAPSWSDDILSVFQIVGDAATDITSKVKAGESVGAGNVLVVRIEKAKESPWFGGWSYVDLLRPGVTEKFLEITMGAYEREIGDQFGKRMPGVFTDEPHLRPGGQLHWTPDLPEQFLKRRGYSLTENLASLSKPVGDWRRVRHDYYQTLLDLFVERWAKPYYDYCESKGIEFTGHYWEHEWPNCASAPDNMAMYAWHQRPAIDTLFNQYDEGVHAQFGNTRAVLELSSVANQLGKERTLCEAYGGAGWETRFEDMKRIGDWLYVLGVNTMDEHLSRISMRGARKADYPPSFSYHSPWWEAYHVPATYFARLSAALTHGKQINEILVLEPTTTAWMYQGEPADTRAALGDAFQALVVKLAQAQVEFDLGCEDIIADHGAVKDDRFVVGERAYHTVVIPPLLENLNKETAALLEKFAKNGGVVYSCAGTSPNYIDGAKSEAAATLAASWTPATAETIADTLLGDGAIVQRAEGDQGILYHHRRQFDGGQMLFLVNSSLEEPSRGTVLSGGHAVREWNLETGTVTPYAAQVDTVNFELPPAGSLLLEWQTDGAPSEVITAQVPGDAIAPAGPTTVARTEPNVLTVDFVDVTAGGETLTNAHYSRAAEFAFQKHGLDHNPWDHAVQFRGDLVSNTFAADSGFTATYHFTVEGTPPAGLRAVVESTALYAMTCNGQAVEAIPGEWWFDKSFGVVDISAAVKEGENTLELAATPFTMMHEIAAVYVLGDFALEPAARGFSIAAARPLALGAWSEQGMPLYGDTVAYTQHYEVADIAASYRVELPAWYGSVAEVVVNGASAGYVWRQPWACEIQGLIKAGDNTVEVRVIGTPRNTMGPFHGNAAPGLAGPEHFRRAPEAGPPAGKDYSTVGYGLFSPFALVPITTE